MQENTSTRIRTQELTATSAAAATRPLARSRHGRWDIRPIGNRFVPYDRVRCCVPFQYAAGVDTLAQAEAIVAKLAAFSGGR